MPSFIAELENTPESKRYVLDVVKNSKSNDVTRNPFLCWSMITKTKTMIILKQKITPIYPNLSRFGAGLLLLGLIMLFILPIVGDILILAGLFVSLNGIMFLPYPYIFLFKKGLKRSGYKGAKRIYAVSDSEVFE